jgi:hypothetical protein
VENNFAALRDSQRQLETLLNSMEDAVGQSANGRPGSATHPSECSHR